MSKTIEIVTIKPLTGEIEYQVKEGESILSHGHIVSGEVDTIAEQTIAESDAISKGLIEE